mmetsp:Transcript_50360/g.128158  ORF Transcript_50360/g.128158 Transcript_50360/m.128158 type:complete len:261 (+) Transcript_50360:770-1552(+)
MEDESATVLLAATTSHHKLLRLLLCEVDALTLLQPRLEVHGAHRCGTVAANQPLGTGGTPLLEPNTLHLLDLGSQLCNLELQLRSLGSNPGLSENIFLRELGRGLRHLRQGNTLNLRPGSCELGFRGINRSLGCSEIVLGRAHRNALGAAASGPPQHAMGRRTEQGGTAAAMASRSRDGGHEHDASDHGTEGGIGIAARTSAAVARRCDWGKRTQAVHHTSTRQRRAHAGDSLNDRSWRKALSGHRTEGYAVHCNCRSRR